jgi:hypothetical protein
MVIDDGGDTLLPWPVGMLGNQEPAGQEQMLSINPDKTSSEEDGKSLRAVSF